MALLLLSFAFMKSIQVTSIITLLAFAGGACQSMQYAGPLKASTIVTRPHSRPGTPGSSAVVSIGAPAEDEPASDDDEETPAEIKLKLPNGERVMVPDPAKVNLTVSVTTANHGLGALEGLFGGALIGALGGLSFLGSDSCDKMRTSCNENAGTIVLTTTLVTAGIGLLWGAAVGHRTTYVFGPRPGYRIVK